jgi:hypothetical protein
VASGSSPIAGKACTKGAGASSAFREAGGAASDNAWVSLLHAFSAVQFAGRDHPGGLAAARSADGSMLLGTGKLLLAVKAECLARQWNRGGRPAERLKRDRLGIGNGACGDRRYNIGQGANRRWDESGSDDGADALLTCACGLDGLPRTVSAASTASCAVVPGVSGFRMSGGRRCRPRSVRIALTIRVPSSDSRCPGLTSL